MLGPLGREQVATVGPVRVVQPVELGQLQRGWVLAQGCTPSSRLLQVDSVWNPAQVPAVPGG